MFFSNEIPSGTINGVNLTFTTANPINTIMTTTIDGSIYTGTVTFTAGTYSVTLGDAPTVSVTFSYFDSATGVQVSDGQLVSSLREAFQRRKKDISDVSDEDFWDWCNQINHYAYNYVKGLNFQNYLSDGSYSVTSSPSTQELPSDFLDLVEWGSGIFPVNSDGTNSPDSLPMTNYGSVQYGYYIDSGNIVFTGVSNPTTFTLRYTPNLSEIDSNSDRMLLPVRNQWHMLNALDCCYTIWDQDPNSEYQADQRFINSMNDLVSHISQTPLAFGLNDYSGGF